jgi:two-component system chemotaxis response regulator CheB
VRCTSAPAEQEGAADVPDHLNVEVNIAKDQNAIDAGIERIAEPSRFACPECHGVLLKLLEGGRVRFRCHTGHAYSGESLVAAVDEAVEESLWIAMRALEERGLLLMHMATHAASAPDDPRMAELTARAERARRDAEIIRKLMADQDRSSSKT